MISELENIVSIIEVVPTGQDEIGGAEPPTYSFIREIFCRIRSKAPSQTYEAAHTTYQAEGEILAREEEVEELLQYPQRYRLEDKVFPRTFQVLGIEEYSGRAEFVKLKVQRVWQA
jgi:hypothetical protein